MSRITKDHFSFRCPMNWDGMTPSENGRFCAKCSKEVYDLSDCSLEELRELQRKRGNICGMFKVTGAAAVAAASIASAACQNKTEPPERYLGEPYPPNKSERQDYDVTIVGLMVESPEVEQARDELPDD